MKWIINLMEKGWVPDPLIRFGIRKLNRMRLSMQDKFNPELNLQDKMDFIGKLRQSPIACQTAKANEQHYALPPTFFENVLGPNMKYSCCLWQKDTGTLADAEQAALKQICLRAQIEDGMELLDLGCGWGSFSLWTAATYPECKVTAVSNSSLQREFILNKAKERELSNIEVITSDANVLEIDKSFDRVVSIEMFEHMRNYKVLLERISGWLKPEGKLFIHIFTHRLFAYLFETEGEDNWMGRYFFTGCKRRSKSVAPAGAE